MDQAFLIMVKPSIGLRGYWSWMHKVSI